MLEEGINYTIKLSGNTYHATCMEKYTYPATGIPPDYRLKVYAGSTQLSSSIADHDAPGEYTIPEFLLSRCTIYPYGSEPTTQSSTSNTNSNTSIPRTLSRPARVATVAPGLIQRLNRKKRAVESKKTEANDIISDKITELLNISDSFKRNNEIFKFKKKNSLNDEHLEMLKG